MSSADRVGDGGGGAPARRQGRGPGRRAVAADRLAAPVGARSDRGRPRGAGRGQSGQLLIVNRWRRSAGGGHRASRERQVDAGGAETRQAAGRARATGRCWCASTMAARHRDCSATRPMAMGAGLDGRTTFHRLCGARSGRSAGTPPASPSAPHPAAVVGRDVARCAGRGDRRRPADLRYHAIVSRGSGPAAGWLESLAVLLFDQDDGRLLGLPRSAQALFRPDVVAGLGLQRLELYRGPPQPASTIAALASRFRGDAMRAHPR